MNIGRQVSLHGDFYEPIRHAAQDMGFHNIQLLMWHPSEYTQENADMILKACKDFDVKVSALWCGWTGPRDFGYPGMFHTIGLVPVAWRAQRTNELLAGAEFARKIGVQDIVTHVGFISDNPFDEDRMGVMHAIRHICKTIAPFGQRFLFETGEMIATTLTQLIKDINVENIGINFDCANMIINCRGNSADALRILAPLVRGVHIKDAVPPVGMDPKGKEVKAGEGTANFPELIRILKEAGYDGDLTIEREISDKVQRDIDVMDTKAFLEKLL